MNQLSLYVNKVIIEEFDMTILSNFWLKPSPFSHFVHISHSALHSLFRILPGHLSSLFGSYPRMILSWIQLENTTKLTVDQNTLTSPTQFSSFFVSFPSLLPLSFSLLSLVFQVSLRPSLTLVDFFLAHETGMTSFPGIWAFQLTCRSTIFYCEMGCTTISFFKG